MEIIEVCKKSNQKMFILLWAGAPVPLIADTKVPLRTDLGASGTPKIHMALDKTSVFGKCMEICLRIK